MDEELKQKLNELSLNLIKEIQEGAAWASEQTSLFVQELVRFHVITHGIYSAVLVFFIVSLSALSLYSWSGHKKQKAKYQEEKKTIKYSHERTESDGDDWLFTVIIPPIVAVILFLPCIYHITEVCKGVYAPRVLVIEKLKQNLR